MFAALAFQANAFFDSQHSSQTIDQQGGDAGKGGDNKQDGGNGGNGAQSVSLFTASRPLFYFATDLRVPGRLSARLPQDTASAPPSKSPGISTFILQTIAKQIISTDRWCGWKRWWRLGRARQRFHVERQPPDRRRSRWRQQRGINPHLRRLLRLFGREVRYGRKWRRRR